MTAPRTTAVRPHRSVADSAREVLKSHATRFWGPCLCDACCCAREVLRLHEPDEALVGAVWKVLRDRGLTPHQSDVLAIFAALRGES